MKSYQIFIIQPGHLPSSHLKWSSIGYRPRHHTTHRAQPKLQCHRSFAREVQLQQHKHWSEGQAGPFPSWATERWLTTANFNWIITKQSLYNYFKYTIYYTYLFWNSWSKSFFWPLAAMGTMDFQKHRKLFWKSSGTTSPQKSFMATASNQMKSWYNWKLVGHPET